MTNITEKQRLECARLAGALEDMKISGIASFLRELSEMPDADLEAALRFYADGDHFALGDEDAWDTVTGEPTNFWCDEAGTATVEDGSIAKAALAGSPLPDERDDDQATRIAALKTQIAARNVMLRQARLYLQCKSSFTGMEIIAGIEIILRLY